MANLNKVMLIGRLTRDPEIKTFSNGNKVANISFAVNNSKKNQQSGQWEDVPVWLDLKAYDRETGRKWGSFAEKFLTKGQQIYVGGHLVLEEWDDKATGAKRNKVKIVVDDIQFLGKKGETGPVSGSSAGGSSESSSADLEEVPF